MYEFDKVEVVVLGLSASPAGNNAYALILKELEGERRLPIIIGAFEAQAIALEMEGVMPPRPMTHDFFKNYIDALGASLTEVNIDDLNEGTFFAKLTFDNIDTEMDARPSDAIALAVRFKAPIFVKSDIMEDTGMDPYSQQQGEGPEEDYTEEAFASGYGKGAAGQAATNTETKLKQLEDQLDRAIKNEDYEKAASLRDQIQKLLDN
ncbi:MAG: bifunctional nuclease family protein [Candidatus Kapaibacteriales bacterium]